MKNPTLKRIKKVEKLPTQQQAHQYYWYKEFCASFKIEIYTVVEFHI